MQNWFTVKIRFQTTVDENANCLEEPKLSSKSQLEKFLYFSTSKHQNVQKLLNTFRIFFQLRSFSNFADHNPSNERMTFFPFGKTLPTQLSVFFESDSNFDSGQKFKRERSISKLRFKTFLFHLKKTSSLLIVTIQSDLTSA